MTQVIIESAVLKDMLDQITKKLLNEKQSSYEFIGKIFDQVTIMKFYKKYKLSDLDKKEFYDKVVDEFYHMQLKEISDMNLLCTDQVHSIILDENTYINFINYLDYRENNESKLHFLMKFAVDNRYNTKFFHMVDYYPSLSEIE